MRSLDLHPAVRMNTSRNWQPRVSWESGLQLHLALSAGVCSRTEQTLSAAAKRFLRAAVEASGNAVPRR